MFRNYNSKTDSCELFLKVFGRGILGVEFETEEDLKAKMEEKVDKDVFVYCNKNKEDLFASYVKFK